MEEQIQDSTLLINEQVRVTAEMKQTSSQIEDRVCVKIEETPLSDLRHEVTQLPLMDEVRDIDKIKETTSSVEKDDIVPTDELKPTESDVAAALRLLSAENETLKKKFVEESLERKRLYNEVIELKGNIRVFCRCRPLNQVEIASGTSSVVDIDSLRETELQLVCSDSSKKQFKFDHVFGPGDNQEAVFTQTSPVVTSVLDGFNVCIFAYGQTGTGKTFTMEGTPGNRGVNYRTLEELFRISKERCSTMKYELFVSMLEVYNEKIRDLLTETSTQPLKKLEIKQAAEGTQEIPGLVEERVCSTDEVWELLKTGSRNRAVGSTNANELSSRSHCLFRVTVRGENLVNGQRTRSHLWLVDLAGSERVGRIEVDGERLKESQFINKSLSALGDVISALASKTPHIPYRNSKLTHLLQSSLGGDCKALMFVQISPSAADLGETLCSLNFASRVRGIEHGPARKQADPTEHFKFKQMAEKLKHDEKETKKLHDNLQSLQLKFAAREQLCRSLQEKVRDLENQLAEERKARLQQENRAAAAAAAAAAAKTSVLSTIQQGQRVQNIKKPPLGPSKMRPPLRGITNFLPPPSPIPPSKTGIALPTIASRMEKENGSETSRIDNKVMRRPGRVSIAGNFAMEKMQVNRPKPKRQRVSIATIPSYTPSLSVMNPIDTSTARPKNGGIMARRSFAEDPRRISRIFTPLPELTSSDASGDATPTVCRSKFLGSPPGQQHAGSWKWKYPTMVTLQRRPLVWSPLKQKIQRHERKSLPPSRFA